MVFSNLSIYEQSGVTGIHFDIMDGIFVPRFGLYLELLASVNSLTKLPIEAHVMTENFEPYIEKIVDAGADRIIIHLEASKNIERTITFIKNLDSEVGVALNPETDFFPLEPMLSEIDLILLMAIKPGIPKHPYISSTTLKIAKLRRLLNEKNVTTKVGVDGGVTFGNAREIFLAGADILVCGSGTYFNPINDLNTNINELNKIVNITN